MDFPDEQCRLTVMVGVPNEYIYSPEAVVHNKMNPKNKNDYKETTLKVLFKHFLNFIFYNSRL